MLRTSGEVLEDLRAQLKSGPEYRTRIIPKLADEMLARAIQHLEWGPALTPAQRTNVEAKIKERVAIATLDPVALFTNELGTSISDGPCPHDAWILLVALFGDQRFLLLREASALPSFIQANWECFDSSQREQLRPILEETFGAFVEAEGTGPLTIVELFGRAYADEQAFQALKRLLAARPEVADVVILDGLTSLVDSARTTILKGSALRELQSLASGVDRLLRDLAEAGLRRLDRTVGSG